MKRVIFNVLLVLILVLSLNVVTATPAAAAVGMTWSDTVFTESLPFNFGEIGTSIDVILTEETFSVTAGNKMTSGFHFTAVNVPPGLSVSVEVETSVKASIHLVGTAAAHMAADNISDMGITFLSFAFTGGDAEEVTGSTRSDLSVVFYDPGSITWSTDSFMEKMPDNDGSIATSATLTLTNENFRVTGTMVAGTHYTVANVPSGLNVVINTTGNTAEVTLTGNAAYHAYADRVSNMGITFRTDAFYSTNASAVTGASRNDLQVNFDDGCLTWDGTTFTEAMPNNQGNTPDTVVVTLTGKIFAEGGIMLESVQYNAANVPAGLNLVVNVDNSTQASISLSGRAVSHAAADSIANMSISFTDIAFFSGGASGIAYSSRNDLQVIFYDPGSIDWSDDSFREKIPDNDGSIASTATLTLTDEAFSVSDSVMVLNTHYTVANVPAGLTVVVTGTSNTTAAVTLTGNAAAHSAADSITDLGIIFLDTAFFSGDADKIDEASRNDLQVTFYNGYAVWSGGSFVEKIPDNVGSFDTTINIALTSEAFSVSDSVMVLNTHYTVANVPAGLTVVVTGTSSINAAVTLSGNAAAHTAANTIYDMSITFLDAAFDGGVASGVAGCSRNDLLVDFRDPGAMIWNTEWILEKMPDNEGAIDTTAEISLNNELFRVSGVMTSGTHYTVTNVPAGLTLVVTGTTATTATVAFTGKAADHDAADCIDNLGITFLDTAFVSGNASVIWFSSQTSLNVVFYDPVTMTWGGTTFTEDMPDNVGYSTSQLLVTLVGKTFSITGADFMAPGTHYTFRNAPPSLQVMVQGLTPTQARIFLVGAADSHAAADGISNLGITFLDAAFIGGGAADVNGASRDDLQIIFYDPSSMAWSTDSFLEKMPDNDGSIATTATLTLTSETFSVSDAAMTLNTHYTVANVPAGLTVVVTGTSNTTSVVTLTGDAAAHSAADNISDMSITFLDAAFVGGNAAGVVGSSRNDLQVNFFDPGSVAWSADSFLEKMPDNDGSIATTANLTLTNEAFRVSDAAMILNTHYTVADVPAGLTVVVAGTSKTTAAVTLNGNALAHSAANSTTNMGITFLDAAFVSGNATAVAGSSQTTLAVTYSDPDYVNPYSQQWIYGTTDLFGNEGTYYSDLSGVIQTVISETSEDGKLTINIPPNTRALDKDGNPLVRITAEVLEAPPEPPANTSIIGLPYSFGLAGATFSPPITFAWNYDPAALREGTAEENLVIAYYDNSTSNWIEVPCVVDTVNHRITASITHFTVFAMIGEIPPLAAGFTFYGLTINPSQAQPGDVITISFTVKNTGGTSGSCTVNLEINGIEEAEKTVTIAAGGTQIVSFTVTEDVAGVYAVTAAGLEGSFTVLGPTGAPPTTKMSETTTVTTTPATTTPAAKSAGNTFNWPLFWWIFAGLLLMALLIWLLAGRRKTKKQS